MINAAYTLFNSVQEAKIILLDSNNLTVTRTRMVNTHLVNAAYPGVHFVNTTCIQPWFKESTTNRN